MFSPVAGNSKSEREMCTYELEVPRVSHIRASARCVWELEETVLAEQLSPALVLSPSPKLRKGSLFHRTAAFTNIKGCTHTFIKEKKIRAKTLEG